MGTLLPRVNREFMKLFKGLVVLSAVSAECTDNQFAIFDGSCKTVGNSRFWLSRSKWSQCDDSNTRTRKIGELNCELNQAADAAPWVTCDNKMTFETVTEKCNTDDVECF